MRYHLLGGVEVEEAEACADEHGHKWTSCQFGRCHGPVVAVALLRQRGKGYGAIDGTAMCIDHERVFLQLVRSSTGYLGQSPPVVRPVRS
jgi:hypothetical protein